MNISGTVGYTLLKHKYIYKYVLMFADVHDGVNYCNDNSIMIDDFLNNKDYNNILLEEIVRDNESILTDLWPSSLHTQKLKTLNRNNKKIRPVDIRPLLVPFSWEILENKPEMGNIKFSIYLIPLINLFELKPTKIFKRYIIPEMNYIDESKTFKVSLKTHFLEMKKLFEEFKEKHSNYMNYDLIYIYNNHTDILYILNDIISAIMEWYILLLIHNNDKNTIVHIGLAHSEKVLEFLTKVYQFRIVQENGINKLIDINDLNINANACTRIPLDINKLF